MQLTSIILAAGKGTRMKSSLPKVLHKICGRPLIAYAVDVVRLVGVEQPVVVIGHGADLVKSTLGESVQFVEQKEQLGTGHAVLTARSAVPADSDLVLVTSGDMPLFTAATLEKLVEAQKQNDGPCSMLTVVSDDPRGFGRVLRTEDGGVRAIVEEAQATEEQLAIRELNVGAYCFNAKWLWQALERVPLSPKGEYYLTDVVGIAVSDGEHVAGIQVEDQEEAMGINTRIHLSQAEATMRKRILNRLMLDGVTIIDPASTYVEAGVQIGQDTIIQPNTFLRGSTIIGQGCEIGPNTIMTDCTVGHHCVILAAVMEKAVVEDDVDMGPFARLRKGAHLGRGVHMGNFGEVKDSFLDEGTKMGHFSYIGNANIGKNVNIGAGTITCNYDGKQKHATVIGDDVFIGSDTMLVAPVTIGKGAHTGAGAVVTHDVNQGDTVIGVPAKTMRKQEKSE